MKVFENRENMVESGSLGNDMCCKVLDFLKSDKLNCCCTQ